MPKELTYGETLVWKVVEHGSPVTEEIECPVVDVRWQRDQGFIQIVTRLYEAEVPGPEEQNPIPAKYGYHVTMNRDAINKLIRDLRRARDQAFGRDE